MCKSRQFIELLEVRVESFIQIELHLCHFTLPEQHLSKYLLISLDTSLCKDYAFIRDSHFLGLIDSVEPSEESIILESIGPSMWILIILLEEVVVVGVLPLIDWL